MPGSIKRRLLVSNLLVLAGFLGLAGAVLDRAYRSSAETAARERLQAHLYTLLATADVDARGRMRLPDALSVPEFNTPDSGLYAEVSGENATYHWRSPSLIGRAVTLLEGVPPGDTHFRMLPDLAILESGITWEDDNGERIPYSLSVATATDALDAQQGAFREVLWRWLGGISLLLLLVQAGLLRWGLSPLREMSDAVRRIEDGAATTIDHEVPRELKGLSDNLNSLIEQNHNRHERLRNSLADLAHSMKTPLAVLRGAGEQCDDELRELLREQTRRIDQIVSYQRQRAAVAGVSSITQRVELNPILRRLIHSLDKVHADHDVQATLRVAENLRVRADEGDLFELFGNLLENAYKHATARVVVSAQPRDDLIQVRIEDDGPGIDMDDVDRLLRRGERADQRHSGEGIGLAVVDEIVHQYGGRLSIDRSEWGGAAVEIDLPL